MKIPKEFKLIILVSHYPFEKENIEKTELFLRKNTIDWEKVWLLLKVHRVFLLFFLAGFLIYIARFICSIDIFMPG